MPVTAPADKDIVKLDRLTSEIIERLEKPGKPYVSEETLVHDAVAAYMAHLMEEGNVPFRLMDELEKDLKEEAWEILRKKTYGHPALHEYRKSTERKRKSRAT